MQEHKAFWDCYKAERVCCEETLLRMSCTRNLHIMFYGCISPQGIEDYTGANTVGSSVLSFLGSLSSPSNPSDPGKEPAQ